MQVDPSFITYAGISASLTPGRNSGFLNMLKLMKDKAKALESSTIATSTPTPSSSSSSSTIPTSSASTSSTPSTPSIASAESVTEKLQVLKPTDLQVIDESASHAGHAGVGGRRSGGTHFKIKVVAACFEGMSLVQRHRMVYTLLSKDLESAGGSIHAISIEAKSLNE